MTDTLGTGWQWLDEDTFGEFYLRQYLIQHLPEDEVDTAATGWGGDQYAVYWNEEQQALVMALCSAWDTPADADEFTATYTRYAELRQGAPAQEQPDGGRCWQAADTLCLYRQGDQTLLILAPDLPTATTLATSVWGNISEVYFAQAAAPALLLILLSSIPLALLTLREK